MLSYDSVSIESKVNLYLVVSMDYYSIEQVLNNFRKSLSMESMNFNKVDFNNVKDGKELKNLLATYPVIDEYRIVFIYNVDFKSSIYKELLKCKIPEYTRVVIPHYIQRRDNIKKDSIINSFSRVPYAEVVYQVLDKRRINSIAKELGVEINNNILDKLLLLDNMDIIKNDLIKISSIMDEDIDEDIILKVISKSNETNMFDLINAISKKDIELSLDILNEIRAKGENDVGITIRLRNKFRELYLIKSYLLAGMSKDEIALKLHCHPYVALLGVNAVKKYSYEKLEQAYMIVFECENKYKSGCKSDLLMTSLTEILAIK